MTITDTPGTVAPASPDALARAIERGRALLLALQRPDGSWDEPCDTGPVVTAQVLVGLHHLGQVAPDEVREMARFLRGAQRADGSFVRYPFAAEGELGATATAWAALHLSPHPDDQRAAARARAFVDRNGGLDAVVGLARAGDLAVMYLAMAGLVDPRRVPCPPLAFVLVPGLVERLARTVQYMAIAGVVQLALVARGLRGDFGPDGARRGRVARRACARAVELLTAVQNPNGTFMNATMLTLQTLCALRAAGLGADDPRVARGVAWLRSTAVRDEARGTYCNAHGSATWTTASYLRVLLATGSSRADAHVARAVAWLLDHQCDAPQPVFVNRQPGAPRTGGWGFQGNEQRAPDCDDTAVVLDVLGLALAPPSQTAAALPPALAARARAAVARGRAWLAAMQNPDGGWAAFTWGHPSKRPGAIMTQRIRLDPAALVVSAPWTWREQLAQLPRQLADPATEDVTARALAALVRTGTPPHAPEITRAVAFLRAQQTEHGGWWGRWGVNYLAATSYALTALARAGDARAQPLVQRAVRWVLARQNADGGFGEQVASYADPRLAGVGPSAAPLTGATVIGLVDAGEAARPEVARAVAWLLARQLPSGAWPDDDYLATLFPPDQFYFYRGLARYIPLEALGRYARWRDARGGGQTT